MENKNILNLFNESTNLLSISVFEGGMEFPWEKLDELIEMLIWDLKTAKTLCRKFHYKEEVLSIKASLNELRRLEKEDYPKYLKKREFEFLPLIENLRMDYYFYSNIEGNKEREKVYFEKELKNYFRNPYLEKSKLTGVYKYDISIVVVAYNKVEYTKQCVESIIRYMPQNLRCEIICLNHGSTDETKEYFESIEPNKQIDIAVNGGGFCIFDRVVEGKYLLMVSNDVIVTANAIENMYKCISSDDNIAMVVATTPNISNNQSIPSSYANLEEMFAFAEKNNVSNSSRWEQKVRLCDPIVMHSVEKKIDCVCGRTSIQPNRYFIDDITSFFYRRKGYRLMLAKDSYCYHFGSVTLKENQKASAIKFIKGRIKCLDEFGFDPWGYGNSYDEIVSNINLKHGDIKILGINSGLGASLIKMKTRYQEEYNGERVYTCAFTQYKMNLEDLRGLVDNTVYDSDFARLESIEDQFDYIFVENLQDNSSEEVWKLIISKIKDNGVILFRVDGNNYSEKIFKVIEAEIFFSNQRNIWLEVKGLHT